MEFVPPYEGYFMCPKLEYFGSDWLEVQTTSLGSEFTQIECLIEPLEEEIYD